MFFQYIYLQFFDIDIVYFKYFPIIGNLQIAPETFSILLRSTFCVSLPIIDVLKVVSFYLIYPENHCNYFCLWYHNFQICHLMGCKSLRHFLLYGLNIQLIYQNVKSFRYRKPIQNIFFLNFTYSSFSVTYQIINYFIYLFIY